MNENSLSTQIMGASIEIHRQLGPGLLESAYEECLAYELSQRQLAQVLTYLKLTKCKLGYC